MPRATPRYWLMKSEPDAFSIDDLAARPRQTEAWDGVRNYQVRNFFRDEFAPGQQAFFYHSSCAEPGVVGVMEVVSAAYPDPTQFLPDHPHYDPGSRREEPRWLLVEVRLRRKFRQPVSLTTLREHGEGLLKGLRVLERGSRLSVVPVSAEHWAAIHRLAGETVC
ncbi:MAG TPA: EVE domain-containing protein [Nevskiaceae bacterium]|nr:EVE domain-containing protein [Nevskiaceae bacterium]